MNNQAIAVVAVIPCYRVKSMILSVIERVPSEFDAIICVDDACPEDSGDFIEANANDPRVVVLRNEVNKGVGGAVTKGYQHAIEIGAKVVVKIDGDGQMDPRLASSFIDPILLGEADYTKGTRFYNVYMVKRMPKLRLFGNAVLSFMTKISSGYWNIFDPTNGYTAISVACLREIPLHGLSSRYFFESDLLFRLRLIKAVVKDIPMKAVYEEEESNLKINKVVGPFLYGNAKNFIKRLVYDYFLRDFNIASILTLMGLPLFIGGVILGLFEWSLSLVTGIPATAGTVMIAALPIITGLQMLLSALNYDVATVPTKPVTPSLEKRSLEHHD